MLGESLRRRHPSPSEKAPEEAPEQAPGRPGGGPRFTWVHGLLAAVVILIGSFGVGYLLSTQVLFPRPETAGTGIAVPSLYGESRAEAEAAVREAGLAVGEVEELASAETEVGRVLAQDPLPGQQLRPGAAVSFAVSGGPPELRVPPVTGMAPGTARDLLESVGFQVSLRQVEALDVPPGLVAGTEPEAGTARRLPTAVTLLVSVEAPSDSLAPEGDAAAGVPSAPRPGGG